MGLLDPFYQGALPAMGQAASRFAGYQDRPVSLGQMLGAMGGAGMQGQMQAQQFNQQNQSFGQQQQMNALSMRNVQQKMAQAKSAEQRAAEQFALYGGQNPALLVAKMKAQIANKKFGGNSVVVNPQSPTGYSTQQINQAGDKRIIGDALPSTYYDINQAKKEGHYKNAFGRYETATKQLNESDLMLADINQMQTLADNVDTGTFAETKLSMQKIFAALGVNVDMSTIANAEALRAKSMDFVLKRISATKGSISEKEMTAFGKSVAGIESTPAGNRMILELSRNITKRKRFEAEAVRKAYTSNSTAKELDNVRFKARLEFGSVVPQRLKVDPAPDTAMPPGTIGTGTNPGNHPPDIQAILNQY